MNDIRIPKHMVSGRLFGMRKTGHATLLLAAIVMALLAFSCSDDQTWTCPEDLEPYAEFNFYFGQEKGDGGEVSDAEWQAYLSDIVTPRFPDGLTVFDARGQWLDNEADRLYSEHTKVLNVLVPAERADAAKQSLDDIANDYVERFDQQVVFKTSRESCAGF